MTGRNVVPTSTFGSLLREYRAAANMTQEALAESSGLSAQAIAALERGIRRSPRPSTIESLAEAVKLDGRQREALVAAARGRPSQAPARPNAAPDAHLDPEAAEALLASMPTDSLPPRAPLPPGSRMELAPNPLFVGRRHELIQLASALRSSDMSISSTGLGGLGKTQLAVELVHRYGR